MPLYKAAQIFGFALNEKIGKNQIKRDKGEKIWDLEVLLVV